MTQDKKENKSNQGKLILIATPIGNLGDMTTRAIDALRKADRIAAEDTRNSIRLLNYFDIHTPMISYHEYNKKTRGPQLIQRMQKGETIALITDAGTPGISDPGEELVRDAIAAGISVTALPGPAALIMALILSGFSTRRFVFEAFLPAEKKERHNILSELKGESRTILLYEAPHRLLRTLKELEEALGGDRRIALARELTKRHEEVLHFTLRTASAYYEEHSPRGEFVLVLEGISEGQKEKEAQEKWLTMSIPEHIAYYEQQGKTKKEALRLAAIDRGVTKRSLYNALLKEGGGA